MLFTCLNFRRRRNPLLPAAATTATRAASEIRLKATLPSATGWADAELPTIWALVPKLDTFAVKVRIVKLFRRGR